MAALSFFCYAPGCSVQHRERIFGTLRRDDVIAAAGRVTAGGERRLLIQSLVEHEPPGGPDVATTVFKLATPWMIPLSLKLKLADRPLGYWLSSGDMGTRAGAAFG
jgi:hypothetical protein